jgi:hypothetical protein
MRMRHTTLPLTFDALIASRSRATFLASWAKSNQKSARE